MEDPDDEDLFRQTFENAPAGVTLVGLDGRFLQVNRRLRDLLGYSLEEMRALRFSDVTHPDDRPLSDQLYHRLLSDPPEPRQQLVKRYLRRDGGVVWCLLSATLHKDSEGRPRHIISQIVDITERVRDEELLRAFARRLQEAHEEERERIARELHDELGQMLTGLKIEVDWLSAQLSGDLAARAQAMSDLLDVTIQTVRRLSAGLRPRLLDDLGLAAALDWLVQEICGRRGIVCSVAVDYREEAVSEEARTTLFRICQEALTNVVRHSGARNVQVRLARSDGQLQLTIQDDGVGIDDTDLASPRSLGLVGIRERARLAGGSASFTSGTQGTTVDITIPVSRGQQEPTASL